MSITIELTQDQVDSIADQQGESGTVSTARNDMTFKELFGEPFVAGVYATAGDANNPNKFAGSINRIICQITDDMIGQRFGMSERVSGQGTKAANVHVPALGWFSKKNVGTGQCFQFEVEAHHVGECLIDYNFKDAATDLKSGLEIYCRP